ncbi:hypothetical protein [Paludisphaera sp.]|uniref:hypothetical protein n=1 Tax=Paludisphaera sp. TaxID=2017432 RepID=UPI00301E3574
MPNASIQSLADFLLDAYGRPPDDHRDPDRKISIRIDDRNGSDVYKRFCEISVTVACAGDTLLLRLDNPPLGQDLRDFVEKHGGLVKEGGDRTVIAMNLKSNQARLVRELADAVDRVVGRGRRYPDSNWKWIAPRAAKSLKRLADHLKSRPPAPRRASGAAARRRASQGPVDL